MTLYQIDREIEDLLTGIDPETGEVLFDEERLDELLKQKDNAIEDLALGCKNLAAEAAAIRAEASALLERARRADDVAKTAKRHLAAALGGEKFSTPRVSISFRSSSHVELAESFMDWAKDFAPRLLREKDPEPDKAEIKRLLKAGVPVQFASLVEESNIQIR
jgi:hypothetical protein